MTGHICRIILVEIWSIPDIILLAWRIAFSTFSNKQLYPLIGDSFFTSIQLEACLLFIILSLVGFIDKNNYFFSIDIFSTLLTTRVLSACWLCGVEYSLTDQGYFVAWNKLWLFRPLMIFWICLFFALLTILYSIFLSSTTIPSGCKSSISTTTFASYNF